MDAHGEDREFLPTAVPKSTSKNSSRQHPDSEMASTSFEAQGFENALAAVLNQGGGSISGEKHEIFKRKNAVEPNPIVKNSKKRREDDVKAVGSIPKMVGTGKLVVVKAKKVTRKPIEKTLKIKMDVDKKSPVKKTKMALDVIVKKKAHEKAKEKRIEVVPESPVKKTKAAEKAREKKTQVALKSPTKKTKMAVDVKKTAAEKAKEKRTKVAPKSSVKITKAAEKAKEKKTQVAPKSPTKKTKMAANVKKTAAEKAKEKKTAKVVAKKKTEANSGKKTR